MTITVVFDPPLPSDSPATFNTKAFALLGDLNTWSAEANAMPASFASSVSAALASATTVSVVSGTLGYGAGAGGTVTQATNKSTAVTLHKPCGQIIMNNAALAPSTGVYFLVTNSCCKTTSTIVLTGAADGATDFSNYVILATAASSDGSFYVNVRNVSSISLNNALKINFAIIAGVTL